jgi:hypothetical protein
MRLWMPFMYIKKTASDKLFFIEQKRQRRQKRLGISVSAAETKDVDVEGRRQIRRPLARALIEALIGAGLFLLAVRIQDGTISNFDDLRELISDQMPKDVKGFKQMLPNVCLPKNLWPFGGDSEQKEVVVPARHGKGLWIAQ